MILLVLLPHSCSLNLCFLVRELALWIVNCSPLKASCVYFYWRNYVK